MTGKKGASTELDRKEEVKGGKEEERIVGWKGGRGREKFRKEDNGN